MTYISNNIDLIMDVSQPPFNVYQELSKGLEIVTKQGYEAYFLKKLKFKLEELDIHELSRLELINYFDNSVFNAKEVSVLAFCWGIYFTVMNGKGLPSLLMLSNFLDKQNDAFFERIKSTIYSTQWQNRDHVMALYRRFSSKGELKIPGIDYGYFTKLFFFFSNKNTLPILDKWLTYSFAFLIENDNIMTEGLKSGIIKSIKYPNEKYKDINFRLQRMKPAFYYYYVEYLHNLAHQNNVNLNNLETFLFGWDLREDPEKYGYKNPRLIFKEYLKFL